MKLLTNLLFKKVTLTVTSSDLMFSDAELASVGRVRSESKTVTVLVRRFF